MNPPPPTDGQDEGRDAWLREALRHAPDADVTAPAVLSLAILREARAKARRTAPAPAPQRSVGTRLWVWLAQPAVGAGLATVMTGSVIGLMWWDQSEETARVPSAPVVVAQSPASAGAAPALRQDRAADRQAPGREKSLRARSEQASGEPGPPAHSAGAMAPAAPAPVAAPPNSVAPQAFPAEMQSAAAGPASPGLPAKRSGNAADARASPGSASAPQAWRALRVALNSEAPRWTVQLGDASPRPVDARWNAWLDELDAAVAARWAPVPVASDAALERSAPSVGLLRNGQLTHTLRIAADGVRWERGGTDAAASAVWQAPLGEAQVQALRATLDRISR